MSKEYECTPQSVMSLYPCLDCLSASQMRMMMLWLIADFVSYDLSSNLPQLLRDSACFTCLSAKDKMQAILSMFANFLDFDELEFSEFIEQLKCLQCMKPRQVEAAILYLTCHAWND